MIPHFLVVEGSETVVHRPEMCIRDRSIDRQYRQMENLVSIDDIKKLMEIYHLGKAPLSYALGRCV